MAEAVLIIGARSSIGLATAHAFAQRGHSIQLAARQVQMLEADAADIRLRYDVSVSLHECDVLDPFSYDGWPAALPELPQIAVCAVGVLGVQERAETEISETVAILRANFEGPALVLGKLANAMAERGHGTLVGISSVAGDRGRASNYVYGSAKAGLTAWLSGLRARMARSGVHVVTVIPGFVDTRMTDGMKLPPLLTAKPQEVASAIVRAVERRRNIIYVRRVWRIVMAVIRALPEPLFKKLKF
jgi:short-subunit dehydrogenase